MKNDNLKAEAFLDLLRGAFESSFAVMKPGAPIYVAHADTEGLAFRSAFQSAGFKLSGCLVWAKNSLVLGRSDYQWQHEPILYGWKPGAAHRWYGGRKQTTLVDGGGSAFAVNDDGSVTVTVGGEILIISGENLRATPVCSSLFRAEKPRSSADHPTMKPPELIASMLKNSTRKGDIVLDLFAGSGSTLIACEAHGRLARLVELDPLFCDVIVRRWQHFTGKSAVLEATGRPFSEVASGRT
nr:site-specific DNA-methyltransferase [Desulfuromonas thiophila]